MAAAARSLSKSIPLFHRLKSPSSRSLTLRAQSTLPTHNDDPTEPSSSDPFIRRLENAIHLIIVHKSTPDWLPFVPGASYWVPPPKSRSDYLAQIVYHLAEPLSEEASLSLTTVRGWPCTDYVIQDSSPHLMETWVPNSANVVEQKPDNVDQRLDIVDQKSDNPLKSEEEEG